MHQDQEEMPFSKKDQVTAGVNANGKYMTKKEIQAANKEHDAMTLKTSARAF